ncbi:hypothetical protein BZA77DRAFT_304104 [Pyronema omphalodes]|nr:hypothetical protein BZA77DRAFT_304104 [Pyronema omphalodes]
MLAIRDFFFFFFLFFLPFCCLFRRGGYEEKREGCEGRCTLVKRDVKESEREKKEAEMRGEIYYVEHVNLNIL